MPVQTVDASNHRQPLTGRATLAAAAVGVVTAGSIAGTTAAGAAPTVAIAANTVCDDQRGTFTLTPVTGGGAQAAGLVATVRFAQEYPAVPNVVCTLVNTTASPNVPIVTSAASVTTAGFSIATAAALVTATNYAVTYTVDL